MYLKFTVTLFEEDGRLKSVTESDWDDDSIQRDRGYSPRKEPPEQLEIEYGGSQT